MENEINIYINLSNERFISLFGSIEENRNNIINYIHNYDRYLRYSYRNIFNPIRPILYTYSSLPPLISDDELVFPTFVEQEILIPDDAECGISFELPNCRTSCGHYFCRAEITRWLEQRKNEKSKMTCPTCRIEITTIFIAKNK